METKQTTSKELLVLEKRYDLKKFELNKTKDKIDDLTNEIKNIEKEIEQVKFKEYESIEVGSDLTFKHLKEEEYIKFKLVKDGMGYYTFMALNGTSLYVPYYLEEYQLIISSYKTIEILIKAIEECINVRLINVEKPTE